MYFANYSLNASTINVPADHPTIDEAITFASPGDTVLVAPGTYFENINFYGKAITVTSSGGPRVTIIDGGQNGPVVIFSQFEGPNSVLSGFTLQNGAADFGGGVSIDIGSPTIKNNIIQNNSACGNGGGIGIRDSSPHILNNVIKNNFQSGCSGGGGGGISVFGEGAAIIVSNRIENNIWTGHGGGIELYDPGFPVVANNVIDHNTAGSVGGGGMWIHFDGGLTSNALIVQNLIYANTADRGAGIDFSATTEGPRPVFVNNTIIGAMGSAQGSAVRVDGFDDQVTFYNNLLIGLSGQNAVYCGAAKTSVPPTFTNNDAYSLNGSGFQGTCAGEAGQNGNVSLNPLFVNPTKNNFLLQSASPAINVGVNSAPDIPKKDLAGRTRIVGGTIDLGAYEFQ